MPDGFKPRSDAQYAALDRDPARVEAVEDAWQEILDEQFDLLIKAEDNACPPDCVRPCCAQMLEDDE